MIGDLVQVNRDGLCIKNGTIVKVLGLDSESKLENKGLIGCAGCQPLDKEQFSGGIWCEYLSPIPITPEILEKNGFVKTDDGWECDENRIVTIALHSEISCDMWIAETSYDWKHLRYMLPSPKCVHELQHALLLCGIEKEIVL
jgi:hypothetical protein